MLHNYLIKDYRCFIWNNAARFIQLISIPALFPAIHEFLGTSYLSFIHKALKSFTTVFFKCEIFLVKCDFSRGLDLKLSVGQNHSVCVSRRVRLQWKTWMRCSACGSKLSVPLHTRPWTSLAMLSRSAMKLSGWASTQHSRNLHSLLRFEPHSRRSLCKTSSVESHYIIVILFTFF